jgi:hypothetical protein
MLLYLTVEEAQALINKCKQHCSHVLVMVSYLYNSETILGNVHTKTIQNDLTDEVFNSRYPGFELIYNHKAYGCYISGSQV